MRAREPMAGYHRVKCLDRAIRGHQERLVHEQSGGKKPSDEVFFRNPLLVSFGLGG